MNEPELRTNSRTTLATATLVFVVWSALLVTPVTAAVSGPPDAGTTSLSQPSLSECSDSGVAVHDDLLSDTSKIEAVANGSEVTTTENNTKARINEQNGWYRLRLTNDNNYCVRFTVRIGPDAVPPADLGDIEAVNSSTTGTWTSVRPLDADSTQTKITATVPADTTVMFAPSRYQVVAVGWASEKARNASGFIDSTFQTVQKWTFGTDTLEKRHYQIDPNGSDRVRVPLENPNTSESIEDYQLLYSTDNSTWKPVNTDSGDAVYKEVITDGDRRALVLNFNNESAIVKLTLNPDPLERIEYQWESYTAGLESIWDLVPISLSLGLGLTPLGLVARRRASTCN